MFVASVVMFLSSEAFVVSYRLAVPCRTALRADDVAAITAFHYVAQQIHLLYAPRAYLVFDKFPFHLFIKIRINDLRVDVVIDFVSYSRYSQIPLVAQYPVYRVGQEWLPVVEQPLFVEFADDLRHIDAGR